MSLFPELSIDRRRIRWEDHLSDLTPVERPSDLWYKREDAFAPLGYGGVNGAKLRQLVWWLARGDRRGVLTGASVLSPQVSMTAVVARHLGMPCLIALGATNPTSALRHENVAIAAEAGAMFAHAPVAYNPALQRFVDELARDPYHEGWARVWYGITTEPGASDETVEAFHAVGARQVENVPPEVRTLVMTMGSANSCTSVLYGLARHPPANLERVVLLGIGPVRFDFLHERLAAIERVSGVGVEARFRWRHDLHPELDGGDGPVLVEHHDLHTSRFAAYADRMPWAADGIDFHPTYEGKAMRYLHERPGFDWLHRGDSLFWIVGSAPSRAAMGGRL